MPHFAALGLRASLVIQDLPPTVSLEPITNKSTANTAAVQQQESLITQGTRLTEHFLFPAGCSDTIHFIGEEDQFKFVMVHAGGDLFQKSAVELPSAVKLALQKLKALDEESDGKVSLAPKAVFPHTNIGSKSSSRGRNVKTKTIRKRPQTLRRSASLQPATPGTEDQSCHEAAQINRSLRGTSNMTTTLLRQVPEHHEPLVEPKALGLLMDLPVSLFSRLSIHGGKNSGKFSNDVKVEIFYNGEFAECQIIPGRCPKHSQTLISGRRISFVMARPWTILPFNQNADGSLHDPSRKGVGTAAAAERWANIAAALQEEADGRGVDKSGNPPPTAKYLQTLAALEMPPGVEHVHKRNLARYGVIDIVFSLGAGQKNIGGALQYLLAPFRFADRSLRSNALSSTPKCEVSERLKQEVNDMAGIKRLGSQQEVKFRDVTVKSNSAEEKITLKPEAETEEFPASKVPLISTESTHQPSSLKRKFSLLDQDPVEEQMSLWNNLVDDYQETHTHRHVESYPYVPDIQLPSPDTWYASPDTWYASPEHLDSAPSSISTSARDQKTMTEGMKQRRVGVPPEKRHLDRSSHDLKRPRFSVLQVQHPSSPTLQEAGLTTPTNSGVGLDARMMATQPHKTVTAVSKSFPRPAEESGLDWKSPALSRDSVCSYAEPGLYTGNLLHQGGHEHGQAHASRKKSTTTVTKPVFRYIKCAKSGEFVEDEVLIGMRFVVG